MAAKQPPQPQQPRPEWDRILSASQRNNATEISNLIVNHKVSPNHSNTVGQSALHVAALWGNIYAVQTLLKYGADPNAQNRINGATPLHSAVQSMKKPVGNRIKCIQLMLEDTGVDTDTGSEGKLKCNPYITDFYGNNALTSLQEMMKQGDGRIDQEDLAAYNEMEQVLSMAMAMSSERDRDPIFTMIHDLKVQSLKDHLEANANILTPEDINRSDSVTGLNPLLFAIENLFDDDEMTKLKDVETLESIKDIISLLFDYGADINASCDKYIKNQSPFMAMMMPSNTQTSSNDQIYDLCKILSTIHSEAKGDDETKNILEHIILLLVSKGGSISPSTTQILHDAARRGNLKTVRFLIELGVDVNVRGRQGLTPLHFAARSGKVDVINYLLGVGTLDVKVLDDRGKTALEAAFVNDKEEVIDLLQSFYTKDTI